MYCNQCGAQIPDGAKFCNNCGAPAPEATAPGQHEAQPGTPRVNMTEKFIAEKKAQQSAQGGQIPPQGAQPPQNGAYYPPQGRQVPPQGQQRAFPQGYPPQSAQPPQNGAYYAPQGGRQYPPQGAQVPLQGQQGVSPQGYSPQGYPPQGAQPQKRKSGMSAGALIGIIAGVLVLIVVICIVAAISFRKLSIVPPAEQSNVVEPVNPASNETTQRTTEPDAQATEADAQTAAPETAAPTTAKPARTAAPTDPPIDVSNVGNPSPEDFAWYDVNDPDAIPPGSVNLTTGGEIGGRWKACFFYPDAIRELAMIEIWAGDRAVTVEVDPLQINYDGYWESEADMSPWSYEGALDTGTVTAYGDYGQIYLYTFFRYGGKQYALATVDLYNGGIGHIALVRP